MEVDHIASKLRTLWNDWDLRLMVLLSLALQVLLIILGGRRKFTRKLSIRVAVWCAYISADSIAGVALGILSSKPGDTNKESHSLDANSKLIAFWAPALLLLLGGPDTITAYSLEDNELWLRHLLGLMVQTAVTIYIYFMAWALSYLLNRRVFENPSPSASSPTTVLLVDSAAALRSTRLRLAVAFPTPRLNAGTLAAAYSYCFSGKTLELCGFRFFLRVGRKSAAISRPRGLTIQGL